MDEQFKKLLLDAAQKGINGIENTVDWISKQAPELLEQLVTYNLIESGIWTLIGVIGVTVSLILLPKFWKESEEENYLETSGIMKTGIDIIVLIVSFAIFSGNIGTFIKCIFAPKLFIFEYLTSLL